MAAKRITFVDVARGLAIICMVVGHSVGFGWGRDLIYAWHMPLFVLVSGMFITEGTSVRRTLGRNLRKLLVPYFLAETVVQTAAVLLAGRALNPGTLFAQILLGFSLTDKVLPWVPSVNVLWFIPFLMAGQLLFLGILALAKRLAKGRVAREIWKAVLSLGATLTGIVLGVNGLWLPWSLDIALACVGFLYVGHELTRLNIPERLFTGDAAAAGAGDGTAPAAGVGAGASSAAAAGSTASAAPTAAGRLALYSGSTLITMGALALLFAWTVATCSLELAIRHYPGALASMAGGVAGCMLVFWLSAWLERILPAAGRALAWCGRNSFWILIAHFAEMVLVPYEAWGITAAWQVLALRCLIIAALVALDTLLRRALTKPGHHSAAR